MKKIIIIALLSAMGTTLMAQPVFETIINESANICHLESTGYVYYSMDVVNKQCHIYRMDHTLYKSIPLPTLEGYYLSDVQYVSEKLFNNDELVELSYSYSKYNPTTTSYYYTFETKVINENGSVLLTVPGAGLTSVVDVPGAGKKFLVYQYDYSVIPYRTYTHVYALPDSTGQTKAVAAQSIEIGDPFPNPASWQITIPVALPEGESSGILELINMNGKRALSYPLTVSDHHVIIPADNLAPGTYIYHVNSGRYRSPAKKIVVTNGKPGIL